MEYIRHKTKRPNSYRSQTQKTRYYSLIDTDTTLLLIAAAILQGTELAKYRLNSAPIPVKTLTPIPTKARSLGIVYGVPVALPKFTIEAIFESAIAAVNTMTGHIKPSHAGKFKKSVSRNCPTTETDTDKTE